MSVHFITPLSANYVQNGHIGLTKRSQQKQPHSFFVVIPYLFRSILSFLEIKILNTKILLNVTFSDILQSKFHVLPIKPLKT